MSDWGAPLRRYPCGPAIEAALMAALNAVDPTAAVSAVLERRGDGLTVAGVEVGPGRVEILALGKAAAAMTRPVLAALRERAHANPVHATVVTKMAPVSPLRGADVFVGGHPLPTPGSVKAAEALLGRADRIGAGDTAIVLLSGGASSLACAPAPGVSLQQLRSTTDAALRGGRDIETLNAARAPLDILKAGGLAARLAPARVVTLVLSDVPGDSLAVIGSAPTWTPGTTSIHRIVASNVTAVDAAVQSLAASGLVVSDARPHLEGPAEAAGRALVARATTHSGTAVVAGGETTVHVTGTGHGGRNLHVALAAALAADGSPALTLATFATDGEDGPTDAAGAVVTGTTVARARLAGMDPATALLDHDAYPVFDATGDLLRPGPTGTNVCDLAIAVYGHDATAR